MDVIVRNFENQEVGSLALDPSIFGVEPRPDILARVVRWQLAKRRSGNHKTKGVSEISGTTRKPYRQKGTGRARQGSLRSPQFRGGAVIFGPVVRSHEFDLPKKVRKLGLKMALSSKMAEGNLIIMDQFSLESSKTRSFSKKLGGMGLDSVLMIGVGEIDPAFFNASSNLPYVDVLPQQGVNVYDILRRRFLVLHKDAVNYLEGRLK
ncbi:MAG: 50S ribosomal protein L4 [Alphaproteobacteria bacterium]